MRTWWICLAFVIGFLTTAAGFPITTWQFWFVGLVVAGVLTWAEAHEDS